MSAAAAVAEPISPELALVCPELRERALAGLPEPTWEAFLAQARARAELPEDEEERGVSRLVDAAAYVFGLLWPVALGMLAVVVATGVLTLVANATRA